MASITTEYPKGLVRLLDDPAPLKLMLESIIEFEHTSGLNLKCTIDYRLFLDIPRVFFRISLEDGYVCSFLMPHSDGQSIAVVDGTTGRRALITSIPCATCASLVAIIATKVEELFREKEAYNQGCADEIKRHFALTAPPLEDVTSKV